MKLFLKVILLFCFFSNVNGFDFYEVGDVYVGREFFIDNIHPQLGSTSGFTRVTLEISPMMVNLKNLSCVFGELFTAAKLSEKAGEAKEDEERNR